MYHFVRNFRFLIWLVLNTTDILVRIQAILTAALFSRSR